MNKACERQAAPEVMEMSHQDGRQSASFVWVANRATSSPKFVLVKQTSLAIEAYSPTTCLISRVMAGHTRHAPIYHEAEVQVEQHHRLVHARRALSKRMRIKTTTGDGDASTANRGRRVSTIVPAGERGNASNHDYGEKGLLIDMMDAIR